MIPPKPKYRYGQVCFVNDDFYFNVKAKVWGLQPMKDPDYKDQYTFFWEKDGFPKRLVEFVFDPKEIQPCFSKPVDLKRRIIFEECDGLQEFWEERFEYIKNLGHYFTVFDFHAIFDATSKEQLDQLVGIDISCAGMKFAMAV